MSRQAFYILRPFDRSQELVRGVLEHGGGSHAGYWQAKREVLPEPGWYQLLLEPNHFKLKGAKGEILPTEIHPVGVGKGIELGRISHETGVALHGEWILGGMQNMHRTRDNAGVASFLDIR